ncbi:MAG: hypothetical protein WCT44_00720 [Candidatus Paceibacterota bacterium]
MSKRNFILLIIILAIVLVGFFAFLFSQRNIPPGEEGEGTNFLSQFNPFGNGGKKPPTTPPPPTDISGYEPNPSDILAVKLKKVSSMPIAGFTVYKKERLVDVPVPVTTTPPAETTTEETPPTTKAATETAKPTPPLTEFVSALRYVDRATGNVYQTFADKIQERKFSTTTIPKVYEALFGNKGNSVIMRYLKGDDKTIITFVGNLPEELLGGDTTENNEIKGAFLPEDVKDVSLLGDGSGLFYLFNVKENAVGATLNLTNNKKVQVFVSQFTEWLSLYPNNKIITLTTKPASSVPGYMYSVDTSGKGLMTQVLGNIRGLTTLMSPSGKLVLYGDSGLSLGVYHTDTKVSDSVGVRTLPEKCVWGSVSDILYCAVPTSTPSGTYPDSWYQGEVSFSDQIWKIDLATGTSTMIADPATVVGGEDIDGIKLMLDAEENYLFFVNKKDSFLWELGLK